MAKTSAATPKGTKSIKSNKSNPNRASQHPKVSEMVNTAISTQKERKGSSLQAIKKYIASQYKVDVDKLSPFIKKYLKISVASGTLVQTKGKGASGSFKMVSQKKEKSKPKSAAPKVKKDSKATYVKKQAKPKTPKRAYAIKKSTIKKDNSLKKTEKNLKPEKSKISGIMKIDGTKAPSSSFVIKKPTKDNHLKKAKENLKPQKPKKFSGIMKIDGTKAPSRKT